MNKILYLTFTSLSAILLFACSETNIIPSDDAEENPSFVEAVPVTVTFTNADFIYDGDDIGEGISDGWTVKLYTDMATDPAGNPIGPGYVVQLLLNVPFNESQIPDAEYLTGTYSEMYNSGNFSPGTFVSGYLNRIDLPGETVEMPEATFYASIPDESVEMDYDLIDEGAVSIVSEGEGIYSISGIVVGKKYTKRYFKWTGTVQARNNVRQETPNSTLRQDIINPSFTKGFLQDKGDSFYLGDESYRCVILYLGENEVEMTSGRPSGNGAVLRIEMLVPWDADISTEGIPAGIYTMISRNPDTSIDRDKIVPGIAIPGLPNVFAAWKLSGSWYYELDNGEWTEVYARIDGGSVTVERSPDGSHTIIYDLYDCQKNPRKIQGQISLKL